jgi:uncharacterized protein
VAKGKIRKIIDFLEDNLRKNRLNVSKIVLFGSQVTGAMSPDSDIDLVVVSEDFYGKDIFARVRLIKEAEIMTIRKFMVPLDILALTPEEFESGTSLISEYTNASEIIYSA